MYSVTVTICMDGSKDSYFFKFNFSLSQIDVKDYRLGDRKEAVFIEIKAGI